MFIDMHTHCQEGSFDSYLALYDLVTISKSMGLDAVCITDHDNNGVKEYASRVSNDLDFPIFVGVEILTYEGDILAYGLDEVPEQKLYAQELIDLVNSEGGATIAAHPFRDNNRACGAYLKELVGLQGIEAFNGSTKSYQNLQAHSVAMELNLAATGASDCHTKDAVGTYCTYFYDNIESEKDLIEALKEARVSPAVYENGKYVEIKTYGIHGKVQHSSKSAKLVQSIGK